MCLAIFLLSLKSTELSWHKIAQHYQAKEKKCNNISRRTRRADFFALWLLSRVFEAAAAIWFKCHCGHWHKTETGLGPKVKVAKEQKQKWTIRAHSKWRWVSETHNGTSVGTGKCIKSWEKIPKTKKMMIFVATHPRHFGISKELGTHLSQIHLLLFYFLFRWSIFLLILKQRASFHAQHIALLGFFPTTLCCGWDSNSRK